MAFVLQPPAVGGAMYVGLGSAAVAINAAETTILTVSPPAGYSYIVPIGVHFKATGAGGIAAGVGQRVRFVITYEDDSTTTYDFTGAATASFNGFLSPGGSSVYDTGAGPAVLADIAAWGTNPNGKRCKSIVVKATNGNNGAGGAATYTVAAYCMGTN